MLAPPATPLVAPPVGASGGDTAVLTDLPPLPARPAPAANRAGRLVLGAVAILFVLLVVGAAVVAGTKDTGTPPPRPVPTDAPDRLQGPLKALHDAVEGAQP